MCIATSEIRILADISFWNSLGRSNSVHIQYPEAARCRYITKLQHSLSFRSLFLWCRHSQHQNGATFELSNCQKSGRRWFPPCSSSRAKNQTWSGPETYSSSRNGTRRTNSATATCIVAAFPLFDQHTRSISRKEATQILVFAAISLSSQKPQCRILPRRNLRRHRCRTAPRTAARRGCAGR